MHVYGSYLQSGKTQHQVTQFQIQNWSPPGKCSNSQTIITVVEEVFKVQRRTDNKPIVVHCRSAVMQINYNSILHVCMHVSALLLQ